MSVLYGVNREGLKRKVFPQVDCNFKDKDYFSSFFDKSQKEFVLAVTILESVKKNYPLRFGNAHLGFYFLEKTTRRLIL
jgi:hypothetical protein